jgi:hypothetical protein
MRPVHAGAVPATYFDTKRQSTRDLARRQFEAQESGHRVIGALAIEASVHPLIGSSHRLRLNDL